MVWNLFPFKGSLVLGKARSCRAPNLGCRGHWVTWVIWCFTKNLCTRRDAWVGALSWWSCQSPVAHSCAFRIIWIVSVEECPSLTQNLMQVYCSAHSVILNVTATQYTCSHSSVYCPHWLVQWSRHCSHMHIPVHSPWLPGYINVCKLFLLYQQCLDVFWTDQINRV